MKTSQNAIHEFGSKILILVKQHVADTLSPYNLGYDITCQEAEVSFPLYR